MEGGDNTAYNHFMAINMESPVPYIPKQQYHSGNALLLPDMVVSDGPLQPISYQLGEIDNPTSPPDAPATIPAIFVPPQTIIALCMRLPATRFGTITQSKSPQ